MRRLKEIEKFLGRRIILSLFLTTFAAILLGAAEYAFAILLEDFLHSIGMLASANQSLHRWGIGFTEKPTQYLFIAIVAAIFLRGILQLLSSFGTEYSRSFLTARLRIKLFRDVLWQNYARRYRLDEIGNYLGEIFPKAGEAIVSISKSSVAFFECMVILLGMFASTPKLTVFALLSLIATAIPARIINRKILKVSRKIPALNQKVVDSANQSAQNRMFIQVCGIQEAQEAEANGKILKYLRQMLYANFARSSLVAFLPVFALTALMAALYVLGDDRSALAEANLFSFIVLYVRFTQNMSASVNFFTTFINFYPQLAASHAFGVKDDAPPIATASLREFSPPPVPAMVVENLHFSWTSTKVLSNVSCTIPAGSIYGVVGKSGAGKSTFLSLLLGIIEPQSGSIRIGGVEARDWLTRHANFVGYVGVNPFIVNGSLRQNISYGVNRSVSDIEIWSALEKVDLANDVKNLSSGLDQELNEFGDGLSSGQKQRLALARALIRKPVLLILDEATANLDEATEDDILRQIETLRGQMTIIIVSHKPQFKKLYDDQILFSKVTN